MRHTRLISLGILGLALSVGGCGAIVSNGAKIAAKAGAKAATTKAVATTAAKTAVVGTAAHSSDDVAKIAEQQALKAGSNKAEAEVSETTGFSTGKTFGDVGSDVTQEVAQEGIQAVDNNDDDD